MKTLLLRPDSYTDAKCWDDLVYAFTGSLKNSSLDEIILLLHDTIPRPHGWRSKFVRPVSYNRLDEVPELLLSTTSSVLRTGGTPAHQQWPPLEAETGVESDANHDGQEQQKPIDIPEERIEDEEEAKAVVSGEDHEEEIDETRVNAVKVIQDAYRRHLERKRVGAARRIQVAYRRYLERKQAAAQKVQVAIRRYVERKQAGAAKKIQDAYRRHLERKRADAAGKIQAAYRCHLERKRTSAARKIQAAYRHCLERKQAAAARKTRDAYHCHLERKRVDAAKKIQVAYRFHSKEKSVNRVGIDAIQAHYWRLLRERSMEMEWSKDSQYHLLFRVPLGYILVCLDVIKTFVESERKEVTKRMMTEDNRDLEELMVTLDQYRCGTIDHITSRV